MGCSNERIAFARGRNEKCRDTKVANHDLAGRGDKNVRSLEVAVDDGRLVEVTEAVQDLAYNDQLLKYPITHLHT